MPTTQSSRPGWRARLVRMGYWRAIALITMFSIAASVLATGLLSVLLGLREKFELGLLIAAVVPIFVAPLASHLFLRVLFELQDARAALLDLATRDSLTQVYNRRYFMGRFASEAARARRTGEALSLLMIDADEFKPINDRYGHAAGDRTLQEIARVCRETLRPDDVIA
ncbi:MAG TPA: GGDEF domain-containing protein, partial [Dokdonella sp.]